MDHGRSLGPCFDQASSRPAAMFFETSLTLASAFTRTTCVWAAQPVNSAAWLRNSPIRRSMFSGLSSARRRASIRFRITSSGASSTAAWFFAKRETAFTVATTRPTRRVPFTHIVTSDSSVFTTSAGTGGDITVTGNKAGIYLAFGQVGWHPNATYPNSCLIVTDFFGVSVAASSPLSASTSASDPVGEITLIHDAMLAVTPSVPGEISLTVTNWDGSNHNVDAAYYMIQYLPNATLIS